MIHTFRNSILFLGISIFSGMHLVFSEDIEVGLDPNVYNALMESTEQATRIVNDGGMSTTDTFTKTENANSVGGRNGGNSQSSSQNTNTNGAIDVYVTEKIPGAQCVCVADGAEATEDAAGNFTAGTGEAACGTPDTRKYKCSVAKGMTAFQNIIRDITKWFIYITMLFGVLALVGAGILWAWGSESEEYTKKAKGWAFNIIVGLAILFSFRYILGFLAPWIFQ